VARVMERRGSAREALKLEVGPMDGGLRPAMTSEWLETDGLGGYASGTVSGVRTRRYHGLLLVAATPPTGRVLLVNGFDARIQCQDSASAISSQRYAPDVIYPDGMNRIVDFQPEPWPRWIYRLDDGCLVEHQIVVKHGEPLVTVTWRLLEPGKRGVLLMIRPLISGRDFHALHHENPNFRFDATARDGRVVWEPYPGLPSIVARSNGQYTHQPLWYRNFYYEEEQARGLDHIEDLASPGSFHWNLSAGEAIWILSAEGTAGDAPPNGRSALAIYQNVMASERARRRRFPSRLHRSADAYVVRRGMDGLSIVAGYPWFTDWGRDTFISLRGLCIATGRLDVARRILIAWATQVSEGMLPNRFVESAGEGGAEYNAVDSSLWYIVAVHDYLEARAAGRRDAPAAERKVLRRAVEEILDGYSRGTRYGIRMDRDGLLAAGEPGMQLTWMDAKVDGQVVTPRIGKPVEVQALWINALRIGGEFAAEWKQRYERAMDAFEGQFWDEATGYLHDVIDVDHQPGVVDHLFRPNQLFAVGGLPYQIVEGPRARSIVDQCEERLMTPWGPRSLAPGEPGYTPRYDGDVADRDHAYHQGAVWPWLIGPFVEAWVRVRDASPECRTEARQRFLDPLISHLDDAGLGHIPELADAEPPHTPRGCPFQAWSLAEALRLDRVVLG